MRFWWTAAAVFALIALINYFPIFTGQVPFPRDEVLRHSAWNGEPQEQLPELIDIAAMFYPFRALLVRGADERTLPLWNVTLLALANGIESVSLETDDMPLICFGGVALVGVGSFASRGASGAHIPM